MMCPYYTEKICNVLNFAKYPSGEGWEPVGFCHYKYKQNDVRCFCKGNQFECDFYQEIKEQAEKNSTEYKIEEAIKLLKTNGYVIFKEC